MYVLLYVIVQDSLLIFLCIKALWIYLWFLFALARCRGLEAGNSLYRIHNLASKANPTLGCLIEISCDIYIYICVSVVVQKA